MSKSMNDTVAAYKAQLKQGQIQVAYERLIKYMLALRTYVEKHTDFQVGYVSPGYLDFTYFSLFNETLRGKKLRFGIVLNHKEMRFELWLMGQNAAVQKRYWHLLKDTEWNRHMAEMPKYSVLETVLLANPDFDDLHALSQAIVKAGVEKIGKIMRVID